MKNERGFTGLEIILMVIVIAGVGFAGYRAYQVNQEKSEPVTREQTTPQDKSDETPAQKDEAAMFKAAKEFCLANGGSPCNPSLDKRKGNNASVKTESMFVLVSKDSSNEWKAVLGNSSDADICMTGTSAPQLRELCS